MTLTRLVITQLSAAEMVTFMPPTISFVMPFETLSFSVDTRVLRGGTPSEKGKAFPNSYFILIALTTVCSECVYACFDNRVTQSTGYLNSADSRKKDTYAVVSIGSGC